jgi:hypothetical protein
LWRHAETTQEHLAHMTAVAKAGFPGDHIQGMTALLDHHPRRFKA